MAFISQAVGGATQYDASTTALGLIQFDLSNFLAPTWVPRIQFLSLTLQGAAAAVTISVGLTLTAAGNRAELINDTANSFVLSCPFTLGKAANNDIHEIFVVSTGKTGDGLLECIWFPYNASAG
jgi:hypothetical protein